MPSALETLIELAQSRMDDAAKRLGELLSSGQAHEQKLAMLVEYREEYHNRFRSAAQSGISPDAWRNYSVFLAKLDEAVFEQEQVVSRARLQVEAGKQAWVDERNRKKAFDTLATRHQAAALRKENRDEQRMTDEHSAKLFRDKSDDAEDPPAD
ncbi:flagellar export protein FliJ [Niveibacterium sp. 24ML]|uniref:flagellar export protein FliJ n=1 Tax=Niveibacterium sp. 24ML TaxID=2985512 RepID=UPI00226E1FBD|nr:flagellar export protein FliJ [Niveibacterium sp. 24ML]MCX9157938.1 flagellar export protein FliJ [Niveibacterium sp. 24ML]